MSNNPKNRNSFRLLTSVCVLAIAAGISAANAQSETAASDATTGAVTASAAHSSAAANTTIMQSESAAQAEKASPEAAPVVPVRPVHVQPNTRSEQSAHPGRPYFIEFRARSAYNYGHTFVVHGRVGEPLTRKSVVGLHPAGESSAPWMLGHFLPVPSETGWSDGDIGYNDAYILAKYRVYLTEAEYRILLGKMREMQKSSPVWHAALYNCNAFTGDIARFLGMEPPFHWLMPKDYVNGIKKAAGARQELPASWLQRMNPHAAAEQGRVLAAARHQQQSEPVQEAQQQQKPQVTPQTASVPSAARPASSSSRRHAAARAERSSDDSAPPPYAAAQ